MARKPIQLLTASELARLNGCSITPILTLARRGVIAPVYRRHRLALFDEADAVVVAEHLNSQEKTK